jgi:hypothetical protein
MLMGFKEEAKEKEDIKEPLWKEWKYVDKKINFGLS